MTLPLYHTVYHELRHRVASGAYPPGSALPSERKLVEEFGVSMITVRRALDELVLDGLIERQQGRGSFVRDRARSVGVGFSTFNADVEAGRLRLVRTLLQNENVPASVEAAGKLRVQVGSQLRRFVRLDSEGGTPLSVDEVFMPPALATMLSVEVASSPSFVFLWQDLAGISLERTEYEVRVQPPGKAEQEMLQVHPDTPLLVTDEVVFATDNGPVLWAVTRYRSDRVRLYGSYAMVRDRYPMGK